MKQIFTRFGMPLLLAAVSFPLGASEPIFSFTFDDEAAFTDNFVANDGNEDNTTWKWTKYTTGSTPYYYAGCYNLNASSYNDSMTTKEAFTLQKGRAYRLRYQGWADSTPANATLAAGYASSDDPSAIKLIGSDVVKFINRYNSEQGEWYEKIFEVSETGDYVFVFHVTGGQSGASIDNITLEDAGSPDAPAPAASVTAKADSGFALKAKLSIELPSKTITGSTLSSISKVEISRGESIVATIRENLIPGNVLDWTDETASEGDNTYSVVVYNGEEASAPVEASCYVGPLTPAPPTSVTAHKGAGGTLDVSWTAPLKSVNGLDLDVALLRYKVTRLAGETAIVVADNVEGTSFTDTFTSEDIVSVIYRIEAIYGEKVSDPAEATPIKIGSYALPFEESFAGAVMPDGWEVTTSDKSTYDAKKWEVRASTNRSPYAKPYDEDGGLIAYNSYNAQKDYTSQMITPEIRLGGAGAPILEFMFYHSTNSSSNNDRIEIEVSKDGGEFETLPGSEIKRYADKQEWKLYQLPLAAYSDAGSIRISFKAISGYGADMAVDAVKVYAGKSCDLEALSLEGDAKVNAGADANFKFTVRNSAFATAEGSDYEVKVYRGDELYATFDGRTLEPLETTEYDFAVDAHAGHAEAGFPVYAEIEFSKDEDPENNVSAAIEVEVGVYGGPRVTNLSGSSDNTALTLTWDAIESEEYEPMESLLNLDREEYAIAKEDYTENTALAYPATFLDADGNEWKNIDEDGRVSAPTYSFPAAVKGFMSTNKEMTGNSNHVDKTGEASTSMLVAVAPEPTEAASDWLVSPKLPGNGIHRLEFQAKSFSSPCSADFYVEYTVEDTYSADNIAERFMPVGEKVSIEGGTGYGSAGGKWALYSYEIPSDARYVAIHFVGASKKTYSYDYLSDETVEETVHNILCVDDIKLTSEPMAKPSFNIYYREDPSVPEQISLFAEESVSKTPSKHNAEPVAENRYSVALPDVSTEYFVSAVYPQGETALSKGYRYDSTTGITDVDVDTVVRVKVDGREISATASGETIPVSVYAADGRMLISDAGKFIAPEAGVYLVKAGNTTVKVAVR